MARGGIRVPFVADVADFLRGTRRIADDLDDLTGDLADTARASSRSAERVEQDWTRAAKDAEAAFDRFAAGAREAFDRVERDARDAGRGADRALDDEIRRGSFRGAAGALAAEAGQEFVESWGEAIREGNPAGVIRELFSNAALIGAAVGGPAGAAAGIGLSFVTVLIDSVQAQQERLRAAIAAALDAGRGAAAESGAATWAAYRDAFLAGVSGDDALTRAVVGEGGTLSDAVRVLTDKTAALGESLQRDVVAALRDTGTAGDEAAGRLLDAYAATSAELTTLTDRQAEAVANGDTLTAAEAARLVVLQQQNDALGTALGWVRQQDGALVSATQQARLLFYAARDVELANRRAAGGAAEIAAEYGRSAEEVARLRGAIERIPRTVPVSVIVTETRRDTTAATRNPNP